MTQELINKFLSDKRMKEEYDIIGKERLDLLIKIHNILENNYQTYSISGSINSFYICFKLNITIKDPVDIDVNHSNQFNYSINIPLNERDNLVNLLQKEIKGIKKVSYTNDENNTEYNGIVIDPNNELDTFKTGIVKENKNKLVNKYQVINIYEKEVLTLLDKMKVENEEIYLHKGYYQLNINYPYKTKDKTVYETITKDFKDNDFDLTKLVHNNEIFDITHLDHIFIERDLTYFKYYQPRMYYITYLNYLSTKIDINIYHKYKDNFSLFFKENNDELTYEYKFYNLYYDFTQELERLDFPNLKLNELTIEEQDNKLIFKCQNIVEIKPINIYDKFDTLLNILDLSTLREKETDIFGYEGDTLDYLAELLSAYKGINSLEALMLLNPLCSGKIFYDYNCESVTKQVTYLQEFVKYFNASKSFLHTDKCDLEDMLSITDCGSEIIIIDDIEELMKISKHTEEEIINTLDKLNKIIIIFHKLERS